MTSRVAELPWTMALIIIRRPAEVTFPVMVPCENTSSFDEVTVTLPVILTNDALMLLSQTTAPVSEA
ncbi:MAG: hypothetical protein KAS17_11240 [Victivallaceae bacterium]|nr:hypothetical protein [Victivallaceae bacterium]